MCAGNGRKRGHDLGDSGGGDAKRAKTATEAQRCQSYRYQKLIWNTCFLPYCRKDRETLKTVLFTDIVVFLLFVALFVCMHGFF